MLGEVRQGLLTPQTRQLLASLQRPLSTDDGILPTELFPNNALVRVWVLVFGVGFYLLRTFRLWSCSPTTGW